MTIKATKDNFSVLALEGADKNDMTALLRVLAVVGLKRRGAKVKSLTGIINNNYAKASSVIEALDIEEDVFKNLCARLLKFAETAENAEIFVNEFRTAAKTHRLKDDTDTVSGDLASLMPPILTLLSSPDSAGAFATVQKNIGKLKSPDLTQAYSAFAAEDLGDIEELQNELKAACKELTGKARLSLTMEQRTKAREENPDGLRAFNRISDKLKIRIGAELRNTVSSIGDIAPINDVVNSFNERGIPSPIHKGFTKPYYLQGGELVPVPKNRNYIHVNQNGDITDKDGNKADVAGSSAGNVVILNKTYDPSSKGSSWMFLFYSPEESRIIGKRSYAENTVRERKGADFDKLSQSAEHLEGYKKKWRSDFLKKGGIEDAKKVYSATAELLYWTALRPSTGVGNSGGKPTYGATSFLVKHVKIGGTTADKKKNVDHASSIKVTFPVKGAKIHTVTMSANDPHVPDEERKYYKALIDFIIAKTKGKEPDDVVLTIDNKRLNTTFFNQYLKSKGIPFTGKGFRTFRGTQVAIAVLPEAKAKVEALTKKNGGKPLTANVVHGIFNAAMLKVGETLGHKRGEDATHVTAVKYYVDPSVMLSWYKEVGFQPQSNVLKAAKGSNLEA